MQHMLLAADLMYIRGTNKWNKNEAVIDSFLKRPNAGEKRHATINMSEVSPGHVISIPAPEVRLGSTSTWTKQDLWSKIFKEAKEAQSWRWWPFHNAQWPPKIWNPKCASSRSQWLNKWRAVALPAVPTKIELNAVGQDCCSKCGAASNFKHAINKIIST